MQFNVSGMTCGHCAQAITKAIGRVDPQATVKVDVAGGRVTVSSVASAAQIVEAIQTEGYEATPT